MFKYIMTIKNKQIAHFLYSLVYHLILSVNILFPLE
jgi:hypothetical protein